MVSFANKGGCDLGETSKLSYEVLTELTATTAITADWNALLARSECNLAFSSAQWFIATCRAHPQMRPYVIVARRENEIVGILPLVLSGGAAVFPSYLSDYNDIVVSRDDHSVALALLSYATKSATGDQRIVIRNLRDDSQCLRALCALQAAGSIDCLINQDLSCFYLSLTSTYDDYLKTRSKVFRKNLGRALRAAERNKVRVRELMSDTFPDAQLPEIFLSLNLHRFGDGSHFGSAAAQMFVREVFPSLFVEQRLRAFALFLDGQIIGIDICMAGPGSLCTWNGGFVAEARCWSPGTLFFSEGIRRAYELNLNEYDFLRGSHEYKGKWASGTRVLSKCELQPRR